MFASRLIVRQIGSRAKIDSGSHNKIIQTTKLATGMGLITAIYLVRKAYSTKSERLALCEEIPDPDGLFKAPGYKPVKYKECVLSQDMVLSGLMDKISEFEVEKSDIFVSSFPKSGTTWLQQVVYLLIHPEGTKDQEIMEWRFPYLEHVWPGLSEIEKRKSDQAPRLIKTHLPLHLMPKQIKEKKAKVIYIYRNPKDVIVSYYHFARMLNYVAFGGSIQSFAWLLMTDKLPYSPYFTHISQYLEASEKKPHQYMAISYEEMKKNPGRVINKIAEFLEVSVDPKRVEDIAEETTFESMKNNPATNYSHWDKFGLRNKSETQFMRKGEIGDFRNHFDAGLEEDVDLWISLHTAKHPYIKFTFDGHQKPE